MSGVVGQNHCRHSAGVVQQNPFNVPMFEVLGGSFASDLFPNATLTKVTPWVVVRNILDLWDTTNNRVLIPPGHHGIYSFTYHVPSHSIDDGEFSAFQFILNDTTSPGSAISATRIAGLWERKGDADNDQQILQINCEIRMDAGDYLDLRWKQSSGGAVGMDADFTRWTGFKVIGKQGKTVTEPGNWDY